VLLLIRSMILTRTELQELEAFAAIKRKQDMEIAAYNELSSEIQSVLKTVRGK
jgi:hypothetical protein